MEKIRRLQKCKKGKLKAALFIDGSNRFYLTGMKSSAGAVLVTQEEAWLFIDFRYLEEAQQKVKNCKVMEAVHLYDQVREMLQSRDIGEVSIVSGAVTVEAWRRMSVELAPVQVDCSCNLDRMIEKLRTEKDETEIGYHREAQHITDMAFEHILDFIRPGITELDVARELGYTMEKLGGDDHHYNFIVASGKNSALPHGFATNKVLEKGDFLTMDFGAVVHGYFADMTRTVALGSVSEEQERIYNIVYEAQQRAFEKIRAGAVCRDVDAAARNYIYECGYKGCFSHGLGHGVGIDVHENPRFNETCTDPLVSGTVITVEPGIYLKGRFGVRIEDMVVIREDGFEDLTCSPKKLIIL